MPLPKFKSLTLAIDDLRKRGFKCRFKLVKAGMRCTDNNIIYYPNDMYIVEVHRIRNARRRNFDAVVFAIECKDGVKGIATSKNGLYRDLPLLSYMDKVKIKEGHVL